MLTTQDIAARRLMLQAAIAADLMTPNPVSLRAQATASQARALFIAKAISAAPVIDEAGRPVGVLSHSDIIVHDAEGATQATMTVEDLMTPAVFAVSLETAASEVIDSLLSLRIHRLFVVDPQGVLIGVISPMDVLRHLERDAKRSRRGPDHAGIARH
jgi:CBS domain-containing protein